MFATPRYCNVPLPLLELRTAQLYSSVDCSTRPALVVCFHQRDKDAAELSVLLLLQVITHCNGCGANVGSVMPTAAKGSGKQQSACVLLKMPGHSGTGFFPYPFALFHLLQELNVLQF